MKFFKRGEGKTNFFNIGHICNNFEGGNIKFYCSYILQFLIDQLYHFILRTIFAVYEMVGTPADMSKAEELFLKLDQNSDGSISQEEFVNIIKKDHDLLNVLQNIAWKDA